MATVRLWLELVTEHDMLHGIFDADCSGTKNSFGFFKALMLYVRRDYYSKSKFGLFRGNISLCSLLAILETNYGYT